MDGRVDVIYAGSFLHLFGYPDQVEVCKRAVKLLRNKDGSLLLGRQVGSITAGETAHRTNRAQTMFRHNEESFKKMWQEVGDLTKSRWRVEAKLVPLEEPISNGHGGWRDPDQRRLIFAVFREA